jgi:hypothetical protein
MAREGLRSKITGEGNEGRGSSRSRDRDERRLENVKEHRVEKINWRSGERIQRERERDRDRDREGVIRGQQGDCRL